MDFAGAIRLANCCADLPQAWFININSTFAASGVTRPLTKFHWAVSKLPVTLMDTIGHICDNPSAYQDPYQELQSILLESYGYSAAQKTAHLLDHPGQGANKPSILMDQLLALKLDFPEDGIRVLFFRKVHSCICDGVTPTTTRTSATSPSGAMRSGRAGQPLASLLLRSPQQPLRALSLRHAAAA